jgi:hypothetical protein
LADNADQRQDPDSAALRNLLISPVSALVNRVLPQMRARRWSLYFAG